MKLITKEWRLRTDGKQFVTQKRIVFLRIIKLWWRLDVNCMSLEGGIRRIKQNEADQARLLNPPKWRTVHSDDPLIQALHEKGEK